ncbi:MAG: nitrate reductase gamma subunit [Saprospiraceae bacterium]|jgi:nitrate reductase gamma subunit
MIIAAIYAIAFYIAAIVLVFGVAATLLRYIRIPQPLLIPLTPAPISKGGVLLRLLKEFFLFASLFRASRWTWAFAVLFHYGMLVALLKHGLFFTEPIWQWVIWLHVVAPYTGFVMLCGLLGLLARRFVIDRIRYISSPSDYLSLLLLIAIAGSGLMMKWSTPTDIVAVKGFALGLLAFNWQPLPLSPLILIHLALVILLMVIFPISKMIHGFAMLFSPTLNMVDNPREKRYAPRKAGRNNDA